MKSRKLKENSAIYISLPILVYSTWVYWVEPMADKDAILQFYYPLLNFLQGSINQLDYTFLTEEFFNDAYPDGPALLARLVCFTGLQSIVLSEPYLINILLFLPFLIILSAITPRKSIHMIVLLIFFLPGTQILLKGFSPHAFNVTYSFAGILSYINYYQFRKLKWLLFSAFLFWVSIVFKHMGALHYASFMLSYLIWQLAGNRRSLKENLTFFLVPILALPLYPISDSSEYLETTLSHAIFIDTINPYAFFTLLLVTVFFFLGAIKYKSKYHLRPKKCKWFASMSITWALIAFSFWIWIQPFSETSAFDNALVTLILGYLCCSYFIFRYRTSGIRTLLIILTILTLTNNASLYISWIAKSSYLLFLPQLLIVFLWFQYSPSVNRIVFHLVLLVTLSNFFPDLSTLESNPKLKFIGSIYFEGFKTTHQNPLGWSKSPIRKMRQNIQETFEKQRLVDGSLYINAGIHFHTLNVLLFPRNIIHPFGSVLGLDSLTKKSAEELFELWKVRKTQLYEQWTKAAKIKFIIWGDDPFTTRRNTIFRLDEVIEKKVFNPNQFLQAIASDYLEYLQKRESLSDNYKYVAIKELPTLKFMFNHAAASHDRSNNNSLKENGSNREVSNSIKKEAAVLFLESNKYFESNPIKCLELLRKVVEKDPQHLEARKDLQEIIQRLSKDANSDSLK